MANYRFDTNLQALIPPWFLNILEYQYLSLAEGAQLDALALAINAVADNLFFQTMDANTTAAWETILGITADPTEESVEFRRARVLNRISTKPPFSLRFLEGKLDELVGPGNYTITVDYPNYTLYVALAAESRQYFSEIAWTIGKIKPAHIVYVLSPQVSNALTVSEEIRSTSINYNYIMGSWGLGQKPFASVESLGVIKLPTQSSVQSALLTDLAETIYTNAAKARVNSSVIISPLTKSYSGATATISYTVSASDTTAITQLELLDSSNNVLTSSEVYVPVVDTVSPQHIFTVSEVSASGN